MKVKRFFAPDMRRAIKQVRDTLGADAVILSNQQVEGGIEIIAAVDYDEGLLAPATTSSSPATAGGTGVPADAAAPVSRAARTWAGASRDATQASATAGTPSGPESPGAPEPEVRAETRRPVAVDWSQDPAIVAMRDEIRELRGLLENQLAHLAWGDTRRRHPLYTEAMRRLGQMELDSGLMERFARPALTARDSDEAWRQVLAALTAAVPEARDELLDHGGVLALVGSTGVGKTTSVAKLAARYVLRHGARHVALVTTDSYRIGAHEQLMTYGRLLGIPVQVASDPKSLRDTLSSLADKRLVLIDTAGMSQRDLRLTEQFATLADAGVPVRTLLVLSATAHASVLAETLHAFSDVALDGAIVTKLDEAASLGGVLSALIGQQLPLHFMTDGQRVPEDIQVARAGDLVDQAAELARKLALPREESMAERFGGQQAHVHV